MFCDYALHFLKASRMLRGALILLCFATLLCCHTLWRYHHYAQAPIVMPLPTNRPVAFDITFTSAMPDKATYVVRIDLPRNVTGDHYTKALKPLDCYWHVTGSEPIISLYDPQPNSINYPLESYNCLWYPIESYNGFQAMPGHRYTVHVRGKTMSPALRALHPRLIVDISSITDDHLFFQKIMPLLLLCMFLGVLGFACLLSALIGLLMEYYQVNMRHP